MSKPLKYDDTDTTNEDLAILGGTKPKSIHERQLGKPRGPLICDACDAKPEGYQTTQALATHKRYKHQPKTADYYKQDVIRVAFKASINPIWDEKNKIFLYADDIIIPEGYVVMDIEKGTRSVRGHSYNGQHMILVKKDKALEDS